MIQKDKELLLKDLSARLPYNTKIQLTEYSDLTGEKLPSKIKILDYCMLGKVQAYCKGFRKDEIKPYLFPLSSMTEEQLNELKEYSGLKYSTSLLDLVSWTDECSTLEFWLEETPTGIVIKVFDWLNEHHFDYRDLITQGLAIEAKAGNNPYK